MRFLSFVRCAENQGPIPPGLDQAMGRFIEQSLKNGSLVQTGGLTSIAQGSRARLAGGKLTVTDGPFTEGKEVIGGYAMLEAPSLDAAKKIMMDFLELHRTHWPAFEGECEVRQVEFLAP